MKILPLLVFIFLFASAGCSNLLCTRAESECRNSCQQQKVNSGPSSEDGPDLTRSCLDRCDGNLEACNLREEEKARARENMARSTMGDDEGSGANEAYGGSKKNVVDPSTFGDDD